jgi:hypothetical protein
MDLVERARDVAADMARWRDHRWCRCRINKAQILALVETIDPTRKPRTRVVSDARDAARISLELRAEFDRGEDVDNHRLGRAGAESSTALILTLHAATTSSPDLAAIARGVSAAAWAARDAISRALWELDHDMPLAAFSFRATFTSPVYAFEYRANSQLAGVTAYSPYRGVSELYLAGCYVIGYVGDHFIVFAP